MYGRQASGKSTNAEAVRKHFNLTRIVDGVELKPEEFVSPEEPTLFVTNQHIERKDFENHDVSVFSVASMRRQLGKDWQNV